MKLFTISICFVLTSLFGYTDQILPMGNAPEPVEYKHFPNRLTAFVWRNWPLVEAERLAKVLHTTPENVRMIAESMGLPDQHPIAERDKNRIYITLLRRNWHLLPYKQILTLLDFTAEELAHSLREDDFLFIKLGRLKPKCEPIRYSPLTNEEQQRCKDIKQIVQTYFSEELNQPTEKRFQFIEELSQTYTSPASEIKDQSHRFSPCYIYSYFALYGDPLMNPELDPYPDGLLQRLSELGVDGIWMHTVLRQLAPGGVFPELGENHQTRIKNLRTLVERARQFGIGIYLYMNEPRSMPLSFFENHESVRGVQEGDYYALCSTTPEVRKWLTDSLAYVFKQVPDLAGVFTITGSENLTHCASHGRHMACPRCKKRNPADIVAEVNASIEKGVHRSAPDAKVIVWDWGWNDAWTPQVIEQLPKSVYLMSVSEWSKPIERGGVKSRVGEYSLSAVGPGPRAIKHWQLAKDAGLKTMAKMQINNTWELSAVPYLPVMDLVAEHCSNLLSHDVDGLMLSWTLGGYPSPNLELVEAFRQTPPPTKDDALDAIARKYFGKNGAQMARQAWTTFSDAFQEFPFNVGVLYRAPQQYGPANLLYQSPTGYSATMVGIPYDDIDGWRGPYPIDTFASQFLKIAEGWGKGIQLFKKALTLSPSQYRKTAEDQLRFAQVAQLHFASVANQIRFTKIRNDLLDDSLKLTKKDRAEQIKKMKEIVKDEIKVAQRLYTLTRNDSRIGYEASNHYFYIPVDLMEKVINCQYIMDQMS